MTGKILKVSSNDLLGNVDDRKVVLFACFEHTKYMNNYVIFCFEDEYNKNKLYYGSVHLKKDSLVIFSVKDNVKKIIDEFIIEFNSDKMDNYKILDIQNINKVELVSFSEMDYDNLEELDKKTIKRIVDDMDLDNEKKPIFLYLLLFILMLSSLGLTLLYFYPEMFSIKYKELLCKDNSYDQKLLLNYEITKDIKFGKEDKLSSIDVYKVYTFVDSNSYYEFKDNKLYEQYFTDGEAFKFIDNSLSFKLMYQEDSIIDDYEEMLGYLKKEGFSCIEKEYEK